MHSFSTRQHLLGALVLLSVLLTGPARVQAQDQQQLNLLLNGDYSFVLRQNCVSSPGGFESVIRPDGAETFRLLGDASNVGNLVMTGNFHFNGDGTGTLSSGGNETLSIVAFGHPQTMAGGIPFQGISAGDATCSLVYSVGADRTSFSAEAECTATDTGVVLALSAVRIGGRFDPGRRMLILSHTRPNVETVEFICDGCGGAPDGTVLGAIDRVCVRSGTAIRMR